VISCHQTQIWYDSKVVLSCQNHRFKHLNFEYIYPICYKNAKKANPRKRICPYLKTISQQFFIDMIRVFIAAICNRTHLR
jgi:hypothetical protein